MCSLHHHSVRCAVTCGLTGLALCTQACSGDDALEDAATNQSKINNGTPIVSNGVPPYVVQILVKEGNLISHGTGLVMDTNTILTAAHVVYDKARDRQFPPTALTMYRQPDQLQLNAKSIIAHPSYRLSNLVRKLDPDTNEIQYIRDKDVFDVAIIKLRQPLSNLDPARFPHFTTRSASEIASGSLPFIFYGAGPSAEGGSDYAVRSYVPDSATADLENSTLFYAPAHLIASMTTLSDGTQQWAVRGDSGGPCFGFSGDSGNPVANSAEIVGNLSTITIREEAGSVLHDAKFTCAPSFQSWYETVSRSESSPSTTTSVGSCRPDTTITG